MNKIALLIPCLIVLSGCQKEEQVSPAVPAPVAPVVSAEPVQASAPVEALAVTHEPIKKEAAGSAVEQSPPVEKAAAPVVVAPKAEVSAPVATAKPQVAVSETEALALAKKKNCLACHQVDRKVLGPSWKDVAAKYRGDAAAQARLENVIAKGGSGAWGNMPMPAQPQLSEAERALLVRFILNLK